MIGGLLVGIVIGIVIIRGCSIGGIDLVVMFINKVIKFLKLLVILFMLDGFIIVVFGIISKNFMIFIYLLIFLLFIIKIIGFVIIKFGKNIEEINNINNVCV